MAEGYEPNSGNTGKLWQGAGGEEEFRGLWRVRAGESPWTEVFDGYKKDDLLEIATSLPVCPNQARFKKGRAGPVAEEQPSGDRTGQESILDGVRPREEVGAFPGGDRGKRDLGPGRLWFPLSPLLSFYCGLRENGEFLTVPEDVEGKVPESL